MKGPKIIHFSSRCYQCRFADGQQVMTHDVTTGKIELRNVASVGKRARWWGSDGALSTAAENTLSSLETKAASVLRRLRLPLTQQDRAVLAQFFAVHIVRGPSWRQTFERTSLQAVSEEMATQRWEMNDERAALIEIMGDTARLGLMFKQVPRLASLLASMHWSLVEFDAPLVGNGDQPIVVFPMLRACETARIEALPRTGFMDSVEVRIALDPHHILLLTWLDAVEDGTVVHGTFAQAADINRATFAQADRHWFYRPGTHPPRLSPPMLERACQEISYDLLPGYSLDAAFHAQRRAEASELMRSFAEDQVTHAMRWVTFRAVSPVALSPSVSQPAVASQG